MNCCQISVHVSAIALCFSIGLWKFNKVKVWSSHCEEAESCWITNSVVTAVWIPATTMTKIFLYPLVISLIINAPTFHILKKVILPLFPWILLVPLSNFIYTFTFTIVKSAGKNVMYKPEIKIRHRIWLLFIMLNLFPVIILPSKNRTEKRKEKYSLIECCVMTRCWS